MRRFWVELKEYVQDAFEMAKEKERQEEEHQRARKRLEQKELIIRLLNEWLVYLARTQNVKIFLGNRPNVLEHSGTFYVALPGSLTGEKVLRLEKEYGRLCKLCWDDFLEYGRKVIIQEQQNLENIKVQYSRLEQHFQKNCWMLGKIQTDASLEPDPLRQARFVREIQKLEERDDKLRDEIAKLMENYRNISQKCEEINRLIRVRIRPVGGEYNRQPSNRLFLLKIE